MQEIHYVLTINGGGAMASPALATLSIESMSMNQGRVQGLVRRALKCY